MLFKFQEKDFVVMGGLLWWEDQIILGCYNLRDLRDEVSVLFLFIYLPTIFVCYAGWYFQMNLKSNKISQ